MWRKVWWHSLFSPDTRLFLRACNNSGVWGPGHGTGSCSQARASLITILLFPWSLSFFLVSPWVKLSRLCWHSLLRTPPGPLKSDLNIEKQQELDFYSITMQLDVAWEIWMCQIPNQYFHLGLESRILWYSRLKDKMLYINSIWGRIHSGMQIFLCF